MTTALSPLPVSAILLAFFRLMPLFVVSAIMPFGRLPLMVRVVVCFILAILFATIYPHPDSVFSVKTLLCEFIFGIALAFGFHCARAALQTCGRLIDQQMGISAAAVLNPATEQTDSLVAEILTLALMMVFLAIDMHLQILQGLAVIFEAAPLGSAAVPAVDTIVASISKLFILGFLVSAPVIVLLWLTDFALAIASRAMPQANIYFVSLPIKITVGIFSLSVLLRYAKETFTPLLNTALSDWQLLLVQPNG